MTYVINKYGDEIPANVAAMLMDEDLRERLANTGDYDSEQAFFDAYSAAHLSEYGEEWILATEHPQY